MESLNTQLLHLGVLHNVESFKKIYDVDLLCNKSTRLIERYKYFNSEKRLRVYIPRMLHWILKRILHLTFISLKFPLLKLKTNQHFI